MFSRKNCTRVRFVKDGKATIARIYFAYDVDGQRFVTDVRTGILRSRIEDPLDKAALLHKIGYLDDASYTRAVRADYYSKASRSSS